MRKTFGTSGLLLVAALAGGLPAAAAASDQFKQTFDAKLSARAPGKSSGVTMKLKLRDPGEPGGKPKRINGVRVRFPAGTGFSIRRRATCDRAELVERGPGRVPRREQDRNRHREDAHRPPRAR
jgi:hypothetical protein